MFNFCPNCNSLLRVSQVPAGDANTEDHVGQNRFECLTCPFHWILTKNWYEQKPMKTKTVDDVLGGKGAWDNVDQDTAQCPNEKCRNDRAYFYGLQIRSADEPMTFFYKCVKCGKEWRI